MDLVYTSPMTFDPAQVSAVVFDIGGVFTYPDYQPVAQRLTTLGVTAPDDLDEYRRAHHAGVLALARAHESRLSDEYWLAYDAAYGLSLGVANDQVTDVRTAIRTGWDWVHADNVQAFHHLVSTGMPTAVVSNNDGTAPDQMRDHGVCQVGDGPLPSVAAIVDSTLVGAAKPDPRIFDPALTALGLDAASVLYVGDTVHADVAGAMAAGMQVVQLDPFDHHAGYRHSRVTDLNTLVALF